MLTLIIHAALIGIFAVVFVHILCDEGMILSSYARALERLPEWAAKPLGECDLCFAGQIALWLYFTEPGYNFFYHIAYIAVAIYSVIIFRYIYKKEHEI